VRLNFHEDAELQVQVAENGVIVISGEVDMASAPTLEAALVDVDASQPLEIDLSRVTFLDSSGVRTMMQLLHRARQNGSMITLVDPQVAVLRVLEIAGVDCLFLHRTSEPAATSID
jgi:anti-sigma B factor antagonist